MSRDCEYFCKSLKIIIFVCAVRKIYEKNAQISLYQIASYIIKLRSKK